MIVSGSHGLRRGLRSARRYAAGRCKPNADPVEEQGWVVSMATPIAAKVVPQMTQIAAKAMYAPLRLSRDWRRITVLTGPQVSAP